MFSYDSVLLKHANVSSLLVYVIYACLIKCCFYVLKVYIVFII